MNWNRGWVLLGATLLAVGLSSIAWAHPSIEGGIKTGFISDSLDKMGCHLEFVADRKRGELRIYISQAIDENRGGTNHEWVRTLAVHARAVNGKEVDVLPLPDPGKGAEWFSIAPLETKAGFHFYRIELAARVRLDATNPSGVTFKAGKDYKGTCCLKVALDMSRANTIRLEEVKFKLLDPGNGQPAVHKAFFDGMAWGIGQGWNPANTADLPLQKFEDSIAKCAEMNKHRMPDAPQIVPEKSGVKKKK